MPCYLCDELVSPLEEDILYDPKCHCWIHRKCLEEKDNERI